MNSGSEIHLSISGGGGGGKNKSGGQPLRKYPFPVKPGAKPPAPSPSQPMKKRMPPNKAVVAVEEDDPEDNAHFIGDPISPRRKTYRVKEPFSWVVLGGFIWLTLITIFVIVHTVFAAPTAVAVGDSSIVAKAIVPLIEMKKESNKFDVAFNLVPEEGTKGKLMTLALQQMTFESVIRYDVCCYQSNYYMCRSITRNLGVDAYLTKDKTAVIHVIHPDMTGARCTIMWNEKLAS